MRFLGILLVGLVLTVAMPHATSAEPAAAATIVRADISFFRYKPGRLQVQVGTRVQWTNKDSAPHSVTHGTAARPGTAFDSGLFGRGKSWAYTFKKAGVYSYYCSIHPTMVGTVRVVAR